jgi:hypothetical protein
VNSHRLCLKFEWVEKEPLSRVWRFKLEATLEWLYGLLWVDKDSSPLKMYVYDTTLGWREIGA